MQVGKAKVVRSAICTSNEESIVVRGADLSRDLIGKVDFTDYFFLLLTGQRPTPTQSAVLNACLVAIAEHGLVPSNQAARMTLAAAPEAFQGAVAAGILGAGSVVLGSSEVAARFFAEIVAHESSLAGDVDAAATAVIHKWRAAGRPIPGYGHPQHKAQDPRVARLFDLAREAGADLKVVDIARRVERIIPGIVGKELKLNVSGAIPAVLLSVDFPLSAMRGVPILARTASLIAHLNEEQHDPIGFVLQHHAVRDQQYTGILPSKV